MKKTKIKPKKEMCGMNGNACNGGCGFYGLGFLGAVVYNISASTSFGTGLLGFLKAIVWPAFLVYDLLKFIGM